MRLKSAPWLALASLAGCLAASSASAQEIPGPVVNYYAAQGLKQKHPAVQKPCGCYTTHNNFGCGSLRAETVFIFGRCRSFFGEPCAKEVPGWPLPPGYTGHCSSCGDW